jgi:alpha-aminoadipic semialdehyde synthase
VAHLGIRREDKNHWERRAPLAPAQVGELAARGFRVAVEPSPVRIFDEAAYERAGAEIRHDLTGCRLIAGVKEVAPERVLPGHAHLCFAHVIKAQRHNLPALRRILAAGATLLDYEAMVDESGRRRIGFGRFAGYAGMIDALWALGRRLAAEGLATPFAGCRQAVEYAAKAQAVQAVGELGRSIEAEGVPEALHPLVVGFTGGGRVASGAQEIFDRLPHAEVTPADLPQLLPGGRLPKNRLFKVVFRRDERRDFARHLPYLTVLVNGVFWQQGHPRLVTVEALRRLWQAASPPRLRLLADLSCDLHGSIEATVRLTTPGDPLYVFHPGRGEATPGVAGEGPVVLAVDNLPAELPADASHHFGSRLLPLLADLLAADFDVPFERLALPPSLKAAVLAHRGDLTPRFRYLEGLLASAAA